LSVFLKEARMSFEMYSIARRLRRTISTLFVGFALAGCDSGTEPGVGRLDVVMSQTSSDLAASGVAGEMAVLVGVPLGSVQSILITVDRIEVHRVGSDDDDQPEDAGSEGSGSEGSGTEGEGEDGTEDDDEGSGAWISVDLVAGGVTVDLVGMSPQEIASDAVPGGTYNKLRLFFSASTITFSEDVTVGGGLTYEADTVYDLEIPSGANTGIKVQTGFFDLSNGETETVDVVVDLANSVKNVTANQNRVMMTPVIVGKVGSTQT
jgi:hypothetical protein